MKEKGILIPTHTAHTTISDFQIVFIFDVQNLIFAHFIQVIIATYFDVFLKNKMSPFIDMQAIFSFIKNSADFMVAEK